MKWCKPFSMPSCIRPTLEVRGPTSLPFSGNSAEGARSYIDAGTSLYLVGTELQGIAKDIIRACLADDCPFALQLTSFYHKNVPWVCLGVWIPMRPTCMRVLMKATQLSKLCTAGTAVISAKTEIEIVRLAVRDFLSSEKLTAKRLVSVTCRFAPNSWSFYEQAENSSHWISSASCLPSSMRETYKTGSPRNCSG